MTVVDATLDKAVSAEGTRKTRSVARGAAARTVLLYTINNDFHAAVIGHALGLRGNRVIRWVGQDYPERATGSVSFMCDQVQVRLRAGDETFTPSDIDVVWHRRRTLPVAPSIVDQRDAEFVTNELRVADVSHARLFGDAFWINKRSASDVCDIKTTQLLHAQKAGLAIPLTLISNDTAEIKEFISRVQSCIYKPLGGHVWREGGQECKSYTAVVNADVLPADPLLQAAPGIFQEKVEKAYEVRVQFFGAFCGGIRIESSVLKGGDLDWRIDQSSIVSCEPVVLPPQVYESCRTMMRQLDIVSGGFDFIVDIHGRWVFMEVNEAGQFLFIEAWCQQVQLLDAFCQFIETAEPGFRYERAANPFSLKDACVLAEQAGAIRRS